MLSWFSALTITPVLIKWWLFKNQSQPVAQANANPYGGRFYRLYQQALQALLLRKTLTLTIMAALLAAAIWGSDRCGKTFPLVKYADFLCRSLAPVRYRYRDHRKDDQRY